LFVQGFAFFKSGGNRHDDGGLSRQKSAVGLVELALAGQIEDIALQVGIRGQICVSGAVKHPFHVSVCYSEVIFGKIFCGVLCVAVKACDYIPYCVGVVSVKEDVAQIAALPVHQRAQVAHRAHAHKILLVNRLHRIVKQRHTDSANNANQNGHCN
jgi:hypothetical protein